MNGRFMVLAFLIAACAHRTKPAFSVHGVPEVKPVRVVAQLEHQVQVDGKTYTCFFQVLSDLTKAMPVPPAPAKAACDAAFLEWVRATQ